MQDWQSTAACGKSGPDGSLETRIIRAEAVPRYDRSPSCSQRVRRRLAQQFAGSSRRRHDPSVPLRNFALDCQRRPLVTAQELRSSDSNAGDGESSYSILKPPPAERFRLAIRRCKITTAAAMTITHATGS